MSKFFEDLWESIFTPGPTPSLLIATNVTFAVLQLVLFVLLIATYSIHFIILSGLAGGLWWAINWFARELQVARVLQDEEDEEQKRKQRRRAAVAAATSSPVSTDSETEVEEGAATKGTSTGQSSGGPGQVRQRTTAAAGQAETETDGAGAAPTLAPAAVVATAGALGSQGSQGSNSASTSSQRLSSSRSGVSTEDEWEKVSENEQ